MAFLDADDLWLPNHLAVLERAVGLATDAVLCFGIAEVVDQNGTVLLHVPGTHIDKAWERTREGTWVADRSKIYSHLVAGSYIAVSSTLISRAAATKIGLMDESLRMIEDRDFWLRLSRTGNFVHVPTLVCKKRVHDRNMTNPRNTLQLNQWRFRVLRKMLSQGEYLGLSIEERRSTTTALECLVPDLLYSASQKGVGTYCGTLIDLARNGVFTLDALKPRHLLRAVYQSLAWRQRSAR